MPKGTKVGHTGTLDPLASGLLILLVGRATRLSRYVTKLDKEYEATARFGATSDTLDADGEIILLQNSSIPDESAIRAAAEDFTGDFLQTPPMASAIKVGGERLYALHRRGETVRRESRPVRVDSLTLTSLDPDRQTATFEISCSSGTYVRTLISDLAAALDTGAYLTALRRKRVGALHLENATSPDDLTTQTLYNHIILTKEVVEHLPMVRVSEEVGRRLVCNGRSLEAFGIKGSYGVLCEEELLAVYRDEGSVGRAEVVLCGG